MSFSSVLEHMNKHHIKEIEGLVRKFGGVSNPQNAKLKSVDYEGLDIVYDGGDLRVEFPKKANDNTLRDSIIELCMSVEQTYNVQSVAKEVKEFAKSFGSVVLASLNIKGEVLATYAPVIHFDDKFFIYISEVSEHYESIKTNPENIEMMFLEDESKAKSVILRKRLRYRVQARFVERDSQEFNAVFEQFIAQSGGGGGIKTIRNMTDFHMIELITKKGRFVKGFGQAYELIDDKVIYLGGGGNPHSKNPHSK
ncbi:HugZ family heme oxygenase [Helicobacter fennelliae]|uniref:Putative heme oxygenase n=1 Tax=Helicobacter fennelliae MRY12-0050 TaxID=1325130 RepID=T1CMH5_9HELI|nr:HugZ family heme oxygenase [Helicobacter fennelliae]GAD17944.1 putative heme oxygenase [Helicobacter fennelliae MRY12-0050]STP07635.1 heme iron utilization protein [Helicobacter fennelliae]